MKLPFRRSETREEARQRRRCRMMLGLPPETRYVHVLEGLFTLGALGGVLLGVFAWQLGHLRAAASGLGGILVVAALGAAILRTHRRYRHVAAGVLVLVLLLGLLGATAYRHGYLETLAALVPPTAAALAESIASR